LRRTLYKTIRQPETEKPYVWFVREDGSNLSEVVEDARSVLLTNGMAWFDEFTDLSRVLAYARNERDTNTGTHGLGGLGSPHRAKLIADIEAASPPSC